MPDSTPIASVADISGGKAYARDAEGNVREVSVGDLLFKGEVLITADGVSVDLATIDGEFVNVADAAETAMTTDLVASLAAGNDESELTDESIDDVLNLLAGDGDILEGLEATAAGVSGGGGEGEGHSFIRLGRIVEELNPLGLGLPADAQQQDEEETTGLDEVQPDVPPTVIEPNAVVFSIAGDTTVAEGETAQYIVTSSEPVPVATTVTLTVTLGTAGAEDVDFRTVDLEVVIPAGETQSAPFPVNAVDDYIVDGGETYQVNIDSVDHGDTIENAVIDPGAGSVETTITDGPGEPDGGTGDPDTVTFSITGTETAPEGTVAQYVVTSDKPVVEETTITLTVTLGTAQAGDISFTTVDVVIPAGGTTSGPFSVDAIDDYVADNGENYTVAIDPASVAAIDSIENPVINPAAASVLTTITDTDEPDGGTGDPDTVTFSITGTETVPEGTAAQYVVTSDKPVVEETTITLTVTLGTAQAGDISFTTVDVVIPAGGTTSGPFSVDAIDDYVADNGENYTVAIDPASVAAIDSIENPVINPAAASVLTTITDTDEPDGGTGDPDTVTFSITGTETVPEGTAAQYVVTSDKPVVEETTITLTVTLGTAQAGDISFTTVDVVIPAGGTTSGPFSVDAIDDYVADNGENYTVAIDPASVAAIDSIENPVINPAAASVLTTITDTDEPDGGTGDPDTVTFSITGTETVPEGTAAQYVVTSDKPVVEETTITLTVTLGTAQAGDISFTTVDVVIPAGGTTSGPFSVDAIDDYVADNGENYTVAIDPASVAAIDSIENPVINPAAASVLTTITDTDEPDGGTGDPDTVTFSITGTETVPEGTVAQYVVTSDKPVVEETTITLTVTLGTAQAGDISFTTVDVVIPAGGTTSGPFSVDAIDDYVADNGENYTVAIDPASVAAIDSIENPVINPAAASVLTTITDTDEPDGGTGDPDTVTFSITGTETVPEGTAAQYVVTSDKPVVEETTITLTVTLGTAQAGDISFTTVDVVIPAGGTTSGPFSVDAIDDYVADNGENYTVAIDPASVAAIDSIENPVINPAAASVLTTITDTDEPDGGTGDPDTVTFSITGTETVPEGTVAQYVVTSDKPVVEETTITLTVTLGTAQAGDISFTTVDVVIPAGGTTSGPFSVDAIDDYVADNGENYTVAIDPASVAAIDSIENPVINPAAASVLTTITDTDEPDGGTGDPDTVTFSITGTETVPEGTAAQYVVTSDKPVVEETTITLTVTLGTAQAGDISFTTVDVVIPAGGTTSGPFSVDAIDDYVADNGENYTVAIDPASVAAIDSIENPVINPAAASVLTTITDTDEPDGGTGDPDTVTFSITGTETVPEGTAAQYVVTSDKPMVVDTTIALTVTLGSAQAGDISYSTLEVLILAGETTSTPFSVDALEDGIPDNGETYTVAIDPAGIAAIDSIENPVIAAGAASVLTTITDTDRPGPSIEGANGSVSEEGLAGGNADDLGTPDTTDSTTVSGNVGASDFDGGAVNLTLAGPSTAVTSGGVTVEWNFDSVTGVLTGTAGAIEVATLSVNDAGDYSFNLLAPIDHEAPSDPTSSVENARTLDFNVTVTDALNKTASAALNISVEDDSPIAKDVLQLAEAELPVHNVVLVLDRSISMSYDIGGGVTKMDILQQTMQDFLTAYDGVATLNIQIFAFNTAVTESSWFVNDVAGALDFITGPDMTPNKGTSYNKVMTAVADGFTQPDADQTSLYFISDGYPANDRTAGADKDDPASYPLEEAAWESFLAANGISAAYAAGIGVGIDTDPNAPSADVIGPILNQVSWLPGETDSPTDHTDETDPAGGGATIHLGATAGLLAALRTTVDLEPVRGSLLNDPLAIQPGADGATIASVEFNGVTYLSDGGNLTDEPTALGGTFSFDFSTGQYTYQPTLNAAGLVEEFGFSVIDGDQDTVSFDLKIDVASSTGELTGTGNAELLLGNSEANILSGAGGDDILVGGAGNDTLTGGLGADVFAWKLADAGTPGAPAIDTITDFNAAEGDVLDLSDLLVGENAGNLDGFIFGEADAASSTVTLHISTTGSFNGDAADSGKIDQSIVFEGVTLSGTAADQDIINDMINNAKISTDV